LEVGNVTTNEFCQLGSRKLPSCRLGKLVAERGINVMDFDLYSLLAMNLVFDITVVFFFDTLLVLRALSVLT